MSEWGGLKMKLWKGGIDKGTEIGERQGITEQKGGGG